MEQRKDTYIQLPSDIILTNEGIGLIGRSPQMRITTIKNHLGVTREGISSQSFNAQTLQKMVMNSYVEELKLSLPEMLSKRFEIISVNNLVVYAILYKKLSPSLSSMFFQSPIVKDFNRKNPKNSIVDLNQLNKKALEVVFQKQKEVFDGLKTEMREEVIQLIKRNNTLSEEDKGIQTRSLDKFLAWIDSRIWYLYFVICNTNMKPEMLRAFSQMVAVYLKRTQIATHLSNLLMELVQNAEKAHSERIIVRNNLAGPGEIDRYLRKAENRKTVSDFAAQKKEMLTLAWNMNPERNMIGNQYRIQITISNYGLVNEIQRASINQKMNTNVEGISLAEFYGGGEADKLGAGLGLLYNSYLEDYCREEGIYYRCNIVPEPKLEKTSVIVDIAL